jgi:general secretion pathway protein J
MNWNSTRLSNNNRAFTLLEILIAVFILAVVMSTVYAAYQGTFRIVRESEDKNEIYSMTRTVMQRMFRDFTSASARGGKVTFVARKSPVTNGNFVDLTLTSNAHLAFDDDEPKTGIAEIAYSLEEDPSGEGFRLLRSDFLAAEAGGERSSEGHVILKKIQNLTYAFFDAAGTEYSTWDSTTEQAVQKNRMPTIVGITITLVNDRDQEHPYKFTTKIFMPVSLTASAQ